MIDSNQKYHARAFSPGHITGLFQIFDISENYLEKGSRGAGICISLGSTSTVNINSIQPKEPQHLEHQIQIFINGVFEPSAFTTLKTIELLIESLQKNKLIDQELEIKVMIENSLPLGQGFGLSGAGAFSTALALNEAIGSPLRPTELLEYPHRAEIEQGTGLGDVVAQFSGGLPVRVKPGIPPYGEITKLSGSYMGIDIEDIEIILCVIGSELSTKKILDDPIKRELINEFGKKYIDNLMENPSLESLFKYSYNFARDSKLISQKVNEVLNELKTVDIPASMSMLGNSIFAINPGDNPKIEKILKIYGKTYTCKIDSNGARVIKR
jgi:pantoate kinase